MEEWRDVVGYEGEYQVSNLGNVRSMTRKARVRNGCYAIKKGKMLKKTKNPKGYLCVHLSSHGKAKSIEIQRLVAMAFLPNPNEYPCVNHKDEDKGNNSVDNLEWCTYAYNNAYGECRKKASLSRINGKMSKRVYQYDANMNLIAEHPSLAEVKRTLGYDASKISLCARGERKTAYGYLWKY